MVMQFIKVEIGADDLTREQISDIRDFLKCGFTPQQVARWFSIDCVAMQKQLNNVPRQRTLFADQIGGVS